MKLKSVIIELTNVCQWNFCSYCSSNSVFPWDGHRIVIDKDFLRKLLKEIVDLGVKEVEISGGEPFTCGELLSTCLDYLLDHSIRVKIFTNFLFHFSVIEKKLLKPYKHCSHLVEIHVPFNTTDVLTYMKLLRNDVKIDNPEKTLHALDSFLTLCNNILRTKKFYKYKIGLHFLVTKINYMDYTKVVEYANTLGIDEVSALRLVKHGRAIKYWEILEMNSRDWLNFFTNLEKFLMKYRGYTTLRFGCPINWFFLVKPVTVRELILSNNCLKLSFKCLGGIEHLYIAPTLNIYPCVGAKDFEQLKLGNYKYLNTLIDLFGTKEYGKFLELKKNYVAEECKKCPYFNNYCDSKCLVQKIMYNTKIDPLCEIMKQIHGD